MLPENHTFSSRVGSISGCSGARSDRVCARYQIPGPGSIPRAQGPRKPRATFNAHLAHAVYVPGTSRQDPESCTAKNVYHEHPGFTLVLAPHPHLLGPAKVRMREKTL